MMGIFQQTKALGITAYMFLSGLIFWLDTKDSGIDPESLLALQEVLPYLVGLSLAGVLFLFCMRSALHKTSVVTATFFINTLAPLLVLTLAFQSSVLLISYSLLLMGCLIAAFVYRSDHKAN